MIDLSPYLPYALTALLSLLIGSGFSALFLQRKHMTLERENGRLTAALDAEVNALKHASDTLDARFKATAQEALTQSATQLMSLAQEKLTNAHKDSRHALNTRQHAIDAMIKPMHEKLETLSQTLTHVKGTDEALRTELHTLSKETARLVGALKDPAAQGKWGEFILEGLMEKSGLIKGVHYETQVTLNGDNGVQRPDVLINIPDGLRIVVDAKAPINQTIERLGDTITEAEHGEMIDKTLRQVRQHIKDLGKKNYWEALDSVDFTVMFLPSEQIYSLALRADPDIITFAADRNIIIASPTLLLSLTRVVVLNWRQIELAQNAQAISEAGYDLYKRLLTFTDHMQKIGKNISSALRGYNDTIGSFERSVLPAARKFKDLQASNHTQTDLSIQPPPEDTPRHLNLTAEDDKEKQAHITDI